MNMNGKRRFALRWLTLVLCLALFVPGLPGALADDTEEGSDAALTTQAQESTENTQTETASETEHVHTPGEPKQENSVDPTCVADGGYDKVVYCTECGEEISREHVVQEKSAEYHSWNDGEVATPATCQTQGVMRYTCTLCGATREEAIAVNPDAHVWNEGEVVTPATCAAEGTRLYTCTVEGCGQTRTEAIAVDSEAHRWDDGEVTTQPTVDAVGVKTYTCLNGCGATRTEDIPKLDPTYTVTWKNGDTVLEVDEGLALAATPEYNGEAPAKAATAAATYAFAGWAYEPALDENGGIAGNTVATAQFTETAITYTITWKNGETVLKTAEGVSVGTAPAYDGETPTQAATADNTYTFAGWAYEPALDANGGITGNTVATAQFTAVAVPRIKAFNELPSTVLYLSYKPDLAQVQGLINLPATLGVTLTNDSTSEVGLVWNYDDYSAHDGDGDYTFVSALAEGAPALAQDVTTPRFVVHIGPFTSADGACQYRLSAANDLTIIRWLSVPEGGIVTVPALIDEHPVKAVSVGAFQGLDTLTRVELPAGVTAIGDNAFADCPALETLMVPDSIEPLLGQNLLLNDTAFKNLILRTDLNSTLAAADTVNHTITVDGVETPVSIQLPTAVTDIIVNTNTLTLSCDFTVATEHSATVNAEGTLAVAGGARLTDLGTVANLGVISYAGTVVNCAGAWSGNIPVPQEGGTFIGEHQYDGGKCVVCGAEDPYYQMKVEVSYTGSALTKTYDKTRNVSLKARDFKLTGIVDGHNVEIGSISAAYDKADVGDRTVRVAIKLKGDDAGRYVIDELTLKAKITPKDLIITPTDGQKKTFGASDPTYLTGKVRGLLSGDTVTGRLAREKGESVGKYRIVQGTIDAGSNYAVQVLEGYFTIDAKSINSSDVGLVTIGNQRYTGEAVTPDISMRFGSRTLVQGTDFKVEYKDNVQPGTATVKLTGMGNYTGERETSFRILNIASGVSTSSSSSGGGSYSYSGFDDGEYESMEDFDDFDEEDPDAGKLILRDNVTGEEVDYGTVLFDNDGQPSSFVQFIEEVLPGQWELTIIPDPMEDEETDETLYLDEEAARERYAQLHLRLPLSLVQALTEQGFTDIIYEFDRADLRIPLASLQPEIQLEAARQVEGLDEEGEVEVELAPEVLSVALYDICVEQVENLELTDRETGLLADYEPMTATYRLRVGIITAEEEELIEAVPESLTVDDGDEEQLPAAEALPEYLYPQGLRLLLALLDEEEAEDVSDLPQNAVALYMSYDEPQTDEQGQPIPTVTRDVVETNPAAFVDEEGMLCAEILPQYDGIYAVGIPSGEAPVYAGEDDDSEDVEDFEDFGSTSAAPSILSSIGGSFSVDENGNPVYD